jgi:hypothetical protein
MNLASLNNLPHFISWDFLMIIVVIVLFTLLGFAWRKKRILTIALSLYLARLLAFLLKTPDIFKKMEKGAVTGEAFFFWLLFLGIFLILVLGGISFKTASAKKKTKAQFLRLKGSLYGFFTGGLFISFSLALMEISQLSLLGSAFFLSSLSKIVWLLLPIIGMIIFK